MTTDAPAIFRHKRPSICSGLGREVMPLSIGPDDIDPESIARSLAMEVRFRGMMHPSNFYTVATHSLGCLQLAVVRYPEREALHRWALLHDASEAYLGDVVGPLKHQTAFDAYRAAEHLATQAISEHFLLGPEMPEVKEIDTAMTIAERRILMPPVDWWENPEPDEDAVQAMLRPQMPMQGYRVFREAFKALFPEYVWPRTG